MSLVSSFFLSSSVHIRSSPYGEPDPQPESLLLQLPPELILRIFSYFSIFAFMNNRCVCRQWEHLASGEHPQWSSALSDYFRVNAVTRPMANGCDFRLVRAGLDSDNSFRSNCFESPKKDLFLTVVNLNGEKIAELGAPKGKDFFATTGFILWDAEFKQIDTVECEYVAKAFFAEDGKSFITKSIYLHGLLFKIWNIVERKCVLKHHCFTN